MVRHKASFLGSIFLMVGFLASPVAWGEKKRAIFNSVESVTIGTTNLIVSGVGFSNTRLPSSSEGPIKIVISAGQSDPQVILRCIPLFQSAFVRSGEGASFSLEVGLQPQRAVCPPNEVCRPSSVDVVQSCSLNSERKDRPDIHPLPPR